MSVDTDQPTDLIYLHLSDNNAVYEEEMVFADGKTGKVLWKDVLVEGEYPMSPGPGGAVAEPMRVIPSGESDFKTRTISMSDLVEAHEGGAFKYVTVPTTHKDGVLDNTGYVPSPNGVVRSTKEKPGVRIIEREGKKVFQTALAFTEPDVRGKVERGTIPDCSGGIFFNWLNKHTAKRFRAAMKHVALTPVPFMGNLNPFPANFLSDEGYENVEDINVQVFEFDGSVNNAGSSDGGTSDNTAKAEIIWNEEKSYRFVQQKINDTLNPSREVPQDGRPYVPQPSYYVQDVSEEGTALVEEYFKGDTTRFVIPFERTSDGVKLAPQTRWVEVREAMIAASDEPVFASDITTKLNDALRIQFAADPTIYRVSDVSVNDNRVHIVNRAKGKDWIASYALLADGTAQIAPSEKWEATAPTPAETAAAQPATVTPSKVALSDDPMKERLEAARQRRRQLMSPQSPNQ